MIRFRMLFLAWLAPLASAGPPAAFRLPLPVTFVPAEAAEPTVRSARASTTAVAEITAHPADAPNETWIFTDRVALSLAGDQALEPLLTGLALTLDRTIKPGVFVLQAPDAGVAWKAAVALAAKAGVLAAYPVARPPWTLHDAYAPAPNDQFFRAQFEGVPGQWYLENRDPESGVILGADINIRPAWALTLGEGVTVGVADSGVQMNHLDLADRVGGAPHYNFDTLKAEGDPVPALVRRGAAGAHGTSCAGLIAGTGNNVFGMSGVAPQARIASWVIWSTNGTTVTDERFGDMFRYAPDVVGVQNHSWGPSGPAQRGPSLLEDAGIEDAWRLGRGGRGVVMVRGAGNDRTLGAQAGDDGFANDPRVICVAAVRNSGRPSSYTEPGACVLVAAPAGDEDEGGLFTADLPGVAGANYISYFPPFEYLSDFRYGALGFTGTSAAAPLVSGVAALVLSANPALTARDVQQVLLLSARHFEGEAPDPGLAINGAGLAFSHDLGFGVVDAAEAVRLARVWSNRPAPVEVVVEAGGSEPIPDAGFRVEVQAPDGSEGLILPGLPGTGIHPEVATAWLPLVDLGLATNDPPARLDGRGVLIERGGNTYPEKLARAAEFGAAFAIVYNAAEVAPGSCPGGEQGCVLAGTDFSPIPGIFLGRSAGLALKEAIAANPALPVRLHLNGATRQFNVTSDLQCEHVGVRLRTDHTVRGDLRITLRSPSGTVSVLQRYNGDESPGPVDWTYWSAQHFYEPSAGTWELRVTDQAAGEGSGSLLGATLLVRGVPIDDSDRDGLDDNWELTHLATLAQGPKDDPDEDGASNLRESLAGTDPTRDERSGSPDIGFFNDQRVRVSWAGRAGQDYRVLSGATPGALNSSIQVPGRFPVTSTVLPAPADGAGFFRVETP